MPDIAMCFGEKDGKTCPMAKICHRATAKPNPHRQSFFAILPLKEDGTCSHFWPNGLHEHPDCPCDHPPGTRGPCGGCNCADVP